MLTHRQEKDLQQFVRGTEIVSYRLGPFWHMIHSDGKRFCLYTLAPRDAKQNGGSTTSKGLPSSYKE